MSTSPEDPPERAPQSWEILSHGLGSLVTTPFRCIKILHQIGYDIPAGTQAPYETGSTARSGWRPATWRDARELIKKHGWKGLYTGAPCWAADTIATTVTKMQVNELLRSLDLVKPIIRGSTESMTSYELRTFGQEIMVESMQQCISTVVAYPLRVAGTYATAQLVGGENIYSSSPWGAIRSVIRLEGSDALYKGLFVELAADVVEVVTKATFKRLVEYYLGHLFVAGDDLDDSERQQIQATKIFTLLHLTQELALPFFYPLRLFNTVQMLNGAPIAAGQEPFAPPGLTSFAGCTAHFWPMPTHRGIFRAIPSMASRIYT